MKIISFDNNAVRRKNQIEQDDQVRSHLAFMFHYHFKQQFAEISDYFDKTKNPDGLNQLSEIGLSKDLENIYD